MGEVVLSSEIEHIRPDAVMRYWRELSLELDRVPHIWEPWWTKEEIYYGILEGRFQLWAAGSKTSIHMMVITQILHYSTGAVLQAVMAVGNSLEEHLEGLAASMENAARHYGCVRFEIYGREGWSRVLKAWKPRRAVVLSFPVSKERIN